MVKVVRIADDDDENDNDEDTPGRIPRSLRGQPPSLPTNYSMQVISAVRFAPLIDRPLIQTIIPTQVWDTSIHRHYPDSFRQSCREIMLCSSASIVQPPPNPTIQTNVAAKLPKALWMEILSYTDRNWFQKLPVANESLLRQRLVEEQAAARRDRRARLSAEANLELVERERDMYRLMALQLQTQLQSRNDSMEEMDSVIASEAFTSEPLVVRLGRLSALVRRLQESSHSEDASESDDGDEEVMSLDDDDSESGSEAVSPANRMMQPRTVSIAGHDEV